MKGIPIRPRDKIFEQVVLDSLRGACVNGYGYVEVAAELNWVAVNTYDQTPLKTVFSSRKVNNG